MVKYFNYSLFAFLLIFLFSCDAGNSDNTVAIQPPSAKEDIPSENIAQSIINSAVQTSGMYLLKDAKAEFDFRDKHYTYQRKGGSYEYQRIFSDKEGNKVTDILRNDGLVRLVNGDTTSLEDKKSKAYANSVNSVIYFAFLPFSLNDEAVNSAYLGKVTVKDQTYHKVKVTFNQESGGDDFEDVFIYWFNTDTYYIDYLAYEYHTDEGGMRFREAFNIRTVDGVLIQDYNNYKPKEKGSVNIQDTDKAFEREELVLLSKIELVNVEMTINGGR
jgi:hypothetical protein